MTTLDPTFTDALITLSGSNLTATHANNNSWHRTSSQTPHTTGKWVFEVTANTNGSTGAAGVQISVGVIDDANRLSSGYLGQFGTSEAGLFWDGRGITNNSFSPNPAGDDFPLAGDVVMVHVDLDAGVMYAKVNGGALVTSVPSFTPVGDIWAAIGLDGNASSATINFGATPFINTPEPGYNAWDAILGPVIVSGDITISWNVAEGLTAVPGTMEIRWDVYAFTVGELDVAWDVDALISPAPFVISWNVAESLESVSGQLKIMWNVEVELDVCRAFWVTKDGEGFWKGFKEHSACFSRGPLVNDQYGRYYLVRDDDVPRYTTFKVLELERRTRAQLVSSSYYRLGVPQPQKTPKVAPSGGTEDLTVDRSYVYTWVTAFGEEGPPSEPTVVSGADDGVWLVSNFDIDVPNASERLISTIRIYRTVTSNIGTVEYHFVAEIDFDDGDFSDDISTAIVGANFTLESANYFPPPEGLQNLVEHPNGFFLGNVGRDIYMSEPYLPHAWNPENTLSTLGDVVGFGVFGTSVVVGTKSYPYIVSGISPSSMVLTQHDTAEPCLSRYGIVSMPIGVYYPGPNGLILVNQNGFNTITEGLMTKEEWQSRYDPANIDAARYQNSYVAFYSEVDGFLFTPTDPLYTFVELTNDIPICGLQTDEYSGKTIMSTGTELYEWNPPTGANMNYVWESKEFDVPDPVNFGAFRIIHYGDPVPTDAQIDKWRAYNALRIVNPLGPINWNAVGAAKREYVDDLANDSPEWNQPLGGPVLYKVPEVGQPWPGTDLLTAEFYANDKLVHTKIIATDGMLRLPSGYKATRWRIRLTGSRKVKSVKIAETGRELRTV